MVILRRLANILVVSGAASAILIALLGGGTLTLWKFHLSARSIVRPLIFFAIGVALRIYGDVRIATTERAGVHVVDAVRLAFATLLLVVLGLAVAWQVRACGGLDSYGYVSAASLIASGRLKQPEPLAALLPFESGIRALAPLGYVATPDRTAIVPRFPLGFPLLMVPFLSFGPNAVFIVPLLCAILTVVVAYVFARERADACRDRGLAIRGSGHGEIESQPPRGFAALRRGSPKLGSDRWPSEGGRIPNPQSGRGSWIAAALAATFVATDPIFFNQAIQPMSDVPATMWMLLASWLALRDKPRPLLSGIAAGMAVLTRPVLLLACAVVGVVTLRQSTRSFVRWIIGAGAFVFVQAAIQQWLFGSPLVSGYGSNEHLFQVPRIPANVANYARWMTLVYGPVALAGIAALVTMKDAVRRERWIVPGAAVAFAAGAPYLLYVIFNDWEVTRFLLPGSTLVIAIVAVVITRALVTRLTTPWASAAALMLALAVSTRSYLFVTGHGVANLARAEAKYPVIGEWIRQHTPSNAIVVSSLYSGSIRHYSGRTTIRWDEIPPTALDDSVAAMNKAGRPCYLALDGPEEEDLFRARFGDELADVSLLPSGRVYGRNIFAIELVARR